MATDILNHSAASVDAVTFERIGEIRNILSAIEHLAHDSLDQAEPLESVFHLSRIAHRIATELLGAEIDRSEIGRLALRTAT